MRSFKVHILIFALVFGWGMLLSQENDISVSPIWSLNSPADEIFCTFLNDEIVVSTNKSEIIVDDIHRYTGNFALFQGAETQSYQYSLNKEFLSKRVFADVGTAYYDKNNETFWFSTAYNFNNEKGQTLKIYSMKKTKRGWAKIKSFKFNSEFYSITHPWMNEDGTQLFFATDMEGGAGGMDIWFCNKLEKKKWSDPIWAGNTINTSGNELFPTIHNGDIYYSSDNQGEDLDIYRAFRADNWEKNEKLREPINSDGDDFQMVFRDQQSGFLTSQRAYGEGGDDIYFFRIKSQPIIKNELKFELVFKDTPLRDVQMLFTDIDDVVLMDAFTDNNGMIPAGAIELRDLKKIYVLNTEDHFLKDCILYLVDGKGKRIRSFRFGDEGFFKFEFLPLDMLGELPLLEEVDYGLLTLDLEGQVFADTPGDIGAGEPVFITDSKGNVLAISYTGEKGTFQMEELAPLKKLLLPCG